jgi:hypothetical protein
MPRPSTPSGPQGFALVVTGAVSTSLPAPTISSITPNTGAAESVVAITDLLGSNFQLSGTTIVKLNHAAQPDIVATGVTVVNSGKITCSIDLTGVAEIGKWDIVVINPDAQFVTLSEGFSISVTCLKGDVNRDGLVDGLDVQRFTDLLLNGGAIAVENAQEMSSRALTVKSMRTMFLTSSIACCSRLSLSDAWAGLPGWAIVRATLPKAKICADSCPRRLAS